VPSSLQCFCSTSDAMLAGLVAAISCSFAFSISTTLKVGDVLSTLERRIRSVHRGNVSFLQTVERKYATNSTIKTKSVDEARLMLNEFIEETAERLDTEKVRCDSEVRGLLLELKHLNHAIEVEQLELSHADIDEDDARNTLERLGQTKRETMEEKFDFNSLCTERIGHFQQVVADLEDDVEVMHGIMNQTACDPPDDGSSGEGSAVLMQCVDQHGGSVVKFARPEAQAHLDTLQSARAKQAVQLAMAQMYREGATNDPIEEQVHKVVNPPAGSCSIATHPNCGKLDDKMAELTGDVEDDLERAQMSLEAEERRCHEGNESFTVELQYLSNQITDWGKIFKSAQERVTSLGLQLEDKETQKTELQDANATTSAECTTEIETCESEMCGLKRIRKDLYKMDDKSDEFEDCEVSEWIRHPCTKPCGGGESKYTRTVDQSESGGAKCPPLELTHECNEQLCPIDCDISSWSDWSRCTVTCGEGSRQRTRSIFTHAEHGGTPCGETVLVEPCNEGSCDVDCVLGTWTKERDVPCSRACGGGTKVIRRDVHAPAVGEGSCPSEDSEERMIMTKCNEFACPTEGLFVCDSKVDAMIVLDGSGSLGDDGWSQMQQMGSMLFDAFANGKDTQVGTLLFSSAKMPPLDWSTPDAYLEYYHKYIACSVGMLEGESCGMEWLGHFSDSKQNLTKAAISDAKWPKGYTWTGQALMTAQSELDSNGRNDASKVIIVVTDGKPTHGISAQRASHIIVHDKKVRLIFVPVNMEDSEMFSHWVPEPVNDSIVKVDSFEDMTDPSIVNEIIVDSCSAVAGMWS